LKVEILLNGDIAPKQTAIYQESGWIARVLIVENLSDSCYERYILVLLENLSTVSVYSIPAIGEQFRYVRKRAGAWSGMARLFPDDE
jgi:hypothetical protein